ncbi:M28 family peptidase [Psychrosphaera sp. B3R10]|uniref:M28 family peptidase n=1 Tax=Psychrosphaera sp. I2R16 TaxID=2841558 RepID=UPI001C08E343|nr:M28 family peptidase [Psychrosphaera sp. I2R16]MBU2880384.1 M28 family peptidase [Psychrosphaera sp. I2R16]MBU2987823.1 M28 family peptidase [Psychrosphaera sp. B3R10]
MLLSIGATSVIAIESSASSNVSPEPPIPFLPQASKTALLNDFKRLSHPSMAGRKPGTTGHALAQRYIQKRFKDIGLMPFNDSFEQPFIKKQWLADKAGNNLVGWLRGGSNADQYIVVTAHYDHLGMSRGKMHLGADDNASGVSALLSLAAALAQTDLHYSYIFVATDLEESGLYGAFAFVDSPPVALEKIKLNINLDMLSQGGRRNTLYISGAKKSDYLAPILEQTKARVPLQNFRLKFGHGRQKFRSKSSSNDAVDWRKASDHYAFVKRKIPYIYFGVDTHKHYHQSSDTFENADVEFLSKATYTIMIITQMLDQLDEFH